MTTSAGCLESAGIKGPIAEEIEIHGLPVAEMQGEGGSTIEHEFAGHSPKFVPQAALRGWQNAELGLKVGNHRIRLLVNQGIPYNMPTERQTSARQELEVLAGRGLPGVSLADL